MTHSTLTRVPGVLAGHWTHPSGTTGVTALLFPEGARGAVWVPGSATGSRELGVLDPAHLAGHVHGLCLSGGSAFGLAAADGVMDVLRERGLGFATPFGVVPIVPAAILFDLHTATVRPDREAGAAAARAASRAPLPEGRVGAAAGARVGGATGTPVPGGTGTWAEAVGDWQIGAVAAVNALGAVRDADTGAWVAGSAPGAELAPGIPGGQTTLVAVVTDAPVDRPQLTVIARMASAGMARTLFPAFTAFDGDIVFAVGTRTGSGLPPGDVVRLGHAAANAVARAIVRGVTR